MQQEKKLDINSIIGFVLIGLIFIGFSFYNYYANPQEEVVAKNKSEKVAQKTINNTQNINVNQITNNQKETFSTFENDKIFAKFSTKGGQINQLKIKEYFAYDKQAKDHKKELFLIKDNNTDFGFTFKNKNGQTIDTRNLNFNLIKSNNSEIVLQALVSNAVIEFLYTLEKDYSIKFQVKTQNLQQILADKKIELQFFQKAFALEKGYSQESTYTEINYSYNNFSKDDYWSSKSFEEEEKIDWIAIKQQFFSTVLESDSKFEKTKGYAKILDETENPNIIKEFKFSSEIDAQNEVNKSFTWHFFPLERNYLKSFDKQYEKLIPFGWGIFGWLNVFFLWLYNILGGFGIAAGWIIFWMTIIVKMITSPIMYKQHLQSAMMKVLKPEIDELNAKHKDSDAMKKQQATMELYRKAGVNPMAGCLPALLQMPIFISLYRFFPNVIELRGKSFFWADDLTAYDSITSIPFSIPFYGDHVSLFTILYCAVLLIYTKMTASNMQQPTQEGMPDMRIIMYVMPLMFIFVLNSLASGLSWYYFVSNLINIFIILFIKNFLVNENKIHAKIQENKIKPKKKSKWQEKMQSMMEKAQEQQKLNQKNKK